MFKYFRQEGEVGDGLEVAHGGRDSRLSENGGNCSQFGCVRDRTRV